MMNKRGLSGCVVAGLVALSGCGGGFFIDTNNGTVATSTSGDYVYVVNQTANSLSQFLVGSGTLTPVAGNPIALTTGLSGASVAVTRQNTFVYVGGSGAIKCYSIGTGGALTATTAGGGTATGTFVALETSYDGKWLVGLDSLNEAVTVFSINTSTGALTQTSSITTLAVAGTTPSRQVRFAPNNSYVAASFGTAGSFVFPFNTSTGILSNPAPTNQVSGGTDQGITFDQNSAYVYIARGTTGAGGTSIVSYAVAAITNGVSLTQTATAAGSGAAPHGLLLDTTGTYLYSANTGDSTVSGFSATTGALTAISGSPFASGSGVIALAEDNSKRYVVTVSQGGSQDVTLYAFDVTATTGTINGKLDTVGSSTTGGSGGIALATTH